MIKLLVLHPTPKDPEHFRKYYRDVHMPLAVQLPGLKEVRYSFHVEPFGPSATVPFCVYEAVFPDRATMDRAFQSDIAKRVVDDVKNFGTGGPPTVMVFEVTECTPAPGK